MDLTNRLCIVTGGNSGIGKETVRAFAQRGAYTIMICRSEKRAQQAQQELIADTGNSGIEVIIADLAIQHDVQTAAAEIADKFDQIDVLINNAGIIADNREETIDGIEKTLSVNHLGPFLLTNLLLPQLKRADAARVVNVSSKIHRLGARVFDLDDLQLKDNYSPINAYGISKLCNIMFTYELAKRTKNTPVTTNSLHPGVVGTRLAEDANWLMKLFYKIGSPFMRSPKSGAETSIYLATSDEVKTTSGKYFVDKEETKPTAIAYRDEITKELWERSEKLANLSKHKEAL